LAAANVLNSTLPRSQASLPRSPCDGNATGQPRKASALSSTVT